MNLIETYLTYLNEFSKVTRLLRISPRDLDGQVITPFIPDNILIKVGVEDGKILRVPFCPTIDQCLLAMGTSKVQKYIGKILYVHEPSKSRLKIVENEELVRKKLVPDADITGEVWVINPVKLRLVNKIRITSREARYEDIKWGDKPNEFIRNYYWKYELIEGI